MSKVCFFKLLKLKSFQNPPVLSKEVNEQICTKREAHKSETTSKKSLFDDAKNVVDCEVLMAVPEVYGTLKSVKNDIFFIKEVNEQIFTKRADHKNNIKSTFSDASGELENTTKMLHF